MNALRISCGLAIALVAMGCVDRSTCGMPVGFTVCGSESAGGSGLPPVIKSLVMPTCAPLSEPHVQAHLVATDADNDMDRLKLSFYVGTRVDEEELPASGGAIDGDYIIDWPMPVEETESLRFKIVDKQGGQSAPFCGAVALLR